LSGKANSFEDMIAYVDENGMITSTPLRSLIKPNPLASLKNSTLPLKIAGSSSSFLGVAMIISLFLPCK